MDYVCLIVPLMAKDGRLAKSLAVGKSPGFFLQMNEYQSWLKYVKIPTQMHFSLQLS